MGENQDFIIEGEADAQEFKEMLYQITDATATKPAIDEIMRAYPLALAKLLKAAQEEEDGSKRAELHGGIIATLKKREPSTGHGVAEGVEINPYYALHLKAHKKFLDDFSTEFELGVKNG